MPPVPSAPLKLKSSRPNVSPARLAVELGETSGERPTLCGEGIGERIIVGIVSGRGQRVPQRARVDD